MEIVALYAGSFDPVTKGHVNIVRRACRMFGHVVVAVGVNSGKQYLFSLEERLQRLHQVFDVYPQVEIISYTGLTVDACRQCGAKVLVRGVRNASDWDAEQNIAFVNSRLAPDIETVLLPAEDALQHVSSSNVREILRHGGNVSDFLP